MGEREKTEKIAKVFLFLTVVKIFLGLCAKCAFLIGYCEVSAFEVKFTVQTQRIMLEGIINKS